VTRSTRTGARWASACTTGRARSPSSSRSRATTSVLNMDPPIRSVPRCVHRARFRKGQTSGIGTGSPARSGRWSLSPSRPPGASCCWASANERGSLLRA